MAKSKASIRESAEAFASEIESQIDNVVREPSRPGALYIRITAEKFKLTISIDLASATLSYSSAVDLEHEARLIAKSAAANNIKLERVIL